LTGLLSNFQMLQNMVKVKDCVLYLQEVVLLAALVLVKFSTWRTTLEGNSSLYLNNKHTKKSCYITTFNFTVVTSFL